MAQGSDGQVFRTGPATQNGREVVISTVSVFVGENHRTAYKTVAGKPQEINQNLPQGVVAAAVYDCTQLVNKTLSTVQANLAEGALLVITILFLLLVNIRGFFNRTGNSLCHADDCHREGSNKGQC